MLSEELRFTNKDSQIEHMISYDHAVNILSNFNKVAFEDFTNFVLAETLSPDLPACQDKAATPLPNFTQFYSPNLSFGAWEHIFLIQFYHSNIYKDESTIDLLTQELINSIDILQRRFPYPYSETPKTSKYVNLGSLYICTNLHGIETEIYQKFYDSFQIHKQKIPYEAHFEGIINIDGFLRKKTGEGNEEFCSALSKFIDKNIDGISFEIDKDIVKVLPFQNQNIISGGIGKHISPLETVITTKLVNNYSVFKEFERLINDGSENQLEEFIAAHFQLILGNHYDRIETQIWLRFPEVDIANKERRLDIFARNSLLQDWDLFELKKDMPVAKMYRDVPTFTSEVLSAISQLRNYQRNLQQDKVKNHFAAKGIKYYEPSLNLVVGRTPQIAIEQWRRACVDQSNINILTYDNLLSQAKNQIKAKIDFLNPSLDA